MNNSELNTCCLYTIAVQDNPIFTDKRLHCDSCKETLRYTGTHWQYEPFEGLCNSAKCETEHAHDELPAPRAGERDAGKWYTDSKRSTDATIYARKGNQWIGQVHARFADQIVTEHNQHATLVEQRDRLVKLLTRALSPTMCYCNVMDGIQCWQCEVREVLITIEQEGEA